jgi:hypothetical protein
MCRFVPLTFGPIRQRRKRPRAGTYRQVCPGFCGAHRPPCSEHNESVSSPREHIKVLQSLKYSRVKMNLYCLEIGFLSCLINKIQQLNRYKVMREISYNLPIDQERGYTVPSYRLVLHGAPLKTEINTCACPICSKIENSGSHVAFP